MTTVERIGAAELRQLIISYRDALVAHKEAINRLNVYPVPDGDTGTNMSLTLESVVTELDGVDGDLAAVCQAVAHGSLMGARGNSGVILSQILRGLTSVLRETDGADAPTLSRALESASEGAYGAVMKPVEGTILTVVRETATAATKNDQAGLVAMLEAARSAASDAVDSTPDLLPVLKQAGVVDAGGVGFLLFVDVLLNVVDGRPVPEPDHNTAAPVVTNDGLERADDHSDIGDLRYEVMYFLEAPDEQLPAFKDVWAGIGDSIVVVGGDGLYNCHIHTNDIGAAIEAAVDAGRPKKIRVTDLFEEVEEERWVREAAAAAVGDPEIDRTPVPTGVVAVCTGDGVRRIFHNLKVQEVIAGGQSLNPSTAQILEAVEACPADEVVVLPNNKNIIPVAEQVGALTSKTVRVVPTRGIAEGFASLLAYDPEASADENFNAMSEAASSVIAGEITQAVRDSSGECGPIKTGDYIGVARDGIWAAEPTVAEAAITLLSRLVNDSHEVVTIISGEGTGDADIRRVTQWLADERPGAEPEVHRGGQPLYQFLFGIE